MGWYPLANKMLDRMDFTQRLYGFNPALSLERKT